MRCGFCGAEQDETAVVCGGCGADLLPLRPGERVAGRYEVLSHLGRGGMGSVYRALDVVERREIALKVLRPAGSEPGAERRFRRELELARRVDHPNVCRVHDGGQDGARRFLVMELVEGETLAQRLARGLPSREEALRLARQAAEGLAAVHRAGIVHRDVKSLNLMVDRHDRLRLLDFGIARPTAATAATTGALLGSPEYMSPEQARGRPADARSDVYSLGVVLYELFSGTVPFRAQTPVATLLQHLEQQPRLERVTSELRPLVERALAKDPAQRYADGGELAAALRGLHARAAPRRALVLRALALAAPVVVLAVGWWLGLGADRGAVPRPGGAVSTGPSSTQQAAAAPPPSTGSQRAHAVLTSEPPRRPPAVPSSGGGAETTARSRLTAAAGSQGPAPRERAGEPPSGTTAVDPGTATVPAAEPPPTPSMVESAPAPAREPAGSLLVLVQPWADVSVDGVPRGQTPLGRIALPPGPHAVLLAHPDYQPYPRRVTIRAGETLRLAVDLRTDGVPRR